MTNEFQYTFEPLVSRNDPSFDIFYQIYENSMPLGERKSHDQICAIDMRPDYKILLLKRNNVAIGFSILFVPADEPFCLLEYMAIDSVYRNLGLGRKLFLRTFQDATSKCGAVQVLLEIDSDREQSTDHEMRQKRKQFYSRLGCFRIDKLSYILPLTGKGPVPKMDLMVYVPDRKPIISKSQLERWLKVIYDKVYNCPIDDPRILQMMEPVDDPIILI